MGTVTRSFDGSDVELAAWTADSGGMMSRGNTKVVMSAGKNSLIGSIFGFQWLHVRECPAILFVAHGARIC